MVYVNYSHGENVSEITVKLQLNLNIKLHFRIIHCLFTYLSGNFLSLPKISISVYYVCVCVCEGVKLLFGEGRFS